MDLRPVDSSHLRAVGYDPAARTLRVQFQNGRQYDYADIDPGVHQEILDADSAGQHFAQHIRPYYPGTPVREDDNG